MAQPPARGSTARRGAHTPVPPGTAYRPVAARGPRRRGSRRAPGELARTPAAPRKLPGSVARAPGRARTIAAPIGRSPLARTLPAAAPGRDRRAGGQLLAVRALCRGRLRTRPAAAPGLTALNPGR